MLTICNWNANNQITTFTWIFKYTIYNIWIGIAKSSLNLPRYAGVYVVLYLECFVGVNHLHLECKQLANHIHMNLQI